MDKNILIQDLLKSEYPQFDFKVENTFTSFIGIWHDKSFSEDAFNNISIQVAPSNIRIEIATLQNT